LRLLREVFGAGFVAEATMAVVMTSSDIIMDMDVKQGGRWLTKWPQTVMIEHRQTRPRVHERLGRHLHHRNVLQGY